MAGLRVAGERVPRTAQIPGEQDGSTADGDEHGGGPEDVSRAMQGDGRSGRGGLRIPEAHRPHQLEHTLDIGAGVEGEWWFVLGVTGCLSVRRLLLEEMGAVPEDDRQESGGARTGPHRSVKALADKGR